MRSLPCEHVFHQTCIDRWFETKSFQTRSCPLCKRDPLHSSYPALEAGGGDQGLQDGGGREDVFDSEGGIELASILADVARIEAVHSGAGGSPPGGSAAGRDGEDQAISSEGEDGGSGSSQEDRHTRIDVAEGSQDTEVRELRDEDVATASARRQQLNWLLEREGAPGRPSDERGQVDAAEQGGIDV